MIVFADSSALVKLYADEQDHQLVRQQSGLVVSALARVEVPAATWRKHWMGELDPVDAAVLVAAFETVAAFDSTLRAAAAKEGFALLPG